MDKTKRVKAEIMGYEVSDRDSKFGSFFLSRMQLETRLKYSNQKISNLIHLCVNVPIEGYTYESEGSLHTGPGVYLKMAVGPVGSCRTRYEQFLHLIRDAIDEELNS